MTATPPVSSARLGQNQYGKAETRVVRVVREGAVHHLTDLNVSVALSGAMDEAHLSGSNAGLLTTDAVKNTVYAFARSHGVASPEAFGIHLARHFTTGRPSIHRARVRIESYGWRRITEPATGHSFVRDGQEVRTAEVGYDGAAWQVLGGLTGLTVLNSTDSEFRGFAKDEYTTLAETADRVLATDVNARWRYGWNGSGDAPTGRPSTRRCAPGCSPRSPAPTRTASSRPCTRWGRGWWTRSRRWRRCGCRCRTSTTSWWTSHPSAWRTTTRSTSPPTAPTA